MEEKLVSNMNRDELVEYIRTKGAQDYAAQNGTPLPTLARPKELDDPNTPPELRARVREAYTGALLDRPQNTWTPADRALMGEQIKATLRGLGF